MADKVNAPAIETDGEESVNSEQDAAAGQADEAPEVKLTALQQELERERKARIEAERSYANLRPKLNEHDRELAELRALRDRVNAGQGEEVPNRGVDEAIANEVAATREEVAWMRFQQSHPRYSEFWDEMKEIAADPTYKRTIETYRAAPNGLVLDTFATLHNAYNEVELRRIRKAQTETAGRKAASAAETKKIKAQATISGSGSASEESGLEGLTLQQIMDMDYNELIKHIPVDPNDPPRGI